jgi:hypothetical protein
MAGYVHVQNLPPLVANNTEAVQQLERDCRDSEEIHGGNRVAMIANKGLPAPGKFWISRRSLHPTGNASLGNAARCQRTTVSGVTTRSDFFQSAQNRRARTQKSLSIGWSRARGCLRFSTASCCRSAKFSKSSVRCERKQRASNPNHSRKKGNMENSHSKLAG